MAASRRCIEGSSFMSSCARTGEQTVVLHIVLRTARRVCWRSASRRSALPMPRERMRGPARSSWRVGFGRHLQRAHHREPATENFVDADGALHLGAFQAGQGRSGNDTVDHPRAGVDDVINAIAGACLMARNNRAKPTRSSASPREQAVTRGRERLMPRARGRLERGTDEARSPLRE